MKKQSYLEPLWTKNFILLLVTAVFMYIATFMFTPTLPLFARSIGVTDPSVGGIIILVYTIGSFAPRAIWGNLADSWERKAVYLIGVIIMAAAAPIFGLFISLPGILIIRLIQGIGFSASSWFGIYVIKACRDYYVCSGFFQFLKDYPKIVIFSATSISLLVRVSVKEGTRSEIFSFLTSWERS